MLSLKIEKIKVKIEIMKCDLGMYRDYKKEEIYELWKKSGLTLDKVAEKLHRSPEQARKYCYGCIEGRQMRLKIVDFFKSHINKK